MDEETRAELIELLETARARNKHALNAARDTGQLLARALDLLADTAQPEPQEGTANNGYHRERTLTQA